MKCRSCSSTESAPFVDLGFAPPSNAYLRQVDLSAPELTFPLRTFVCTNCWLVQTVDFVQRELMFNSDYAYFSSTSSAWLAHASAYAEMIIRLRNLGEQCLVVEVASNDGYLLKNFVQARIPCLGIEPASATAAAAEKLGVPVINGFFGSDLGKELASTRPADLIICNNVIAHVPDPNDFFAGLSALLSPSGIITLEFPHVLQLLSKVQFDTIYHEHYSYFSLHSLTHIAIRSALRVCKVEKLPTHGGSLRVYLCHEASDEPCHPSVAELLKEECVEGLLTETRYLSFQSLAENTKNTFLRFLLDCREQGKTVVGYGAAAKGNTLLNFAGVKSDLIACVADASAAKQGKWLPGSHIPVVAPEYLHTLDPDYVVVFPWNLVNEIVSEPALLPDDSQVVTFIPELRYI